MTVQIFGVKKCADTRKAERWFKERRVPLQLIDLQVRGPSAGELRGIAARVPWERLIDREGARYRDKGLRAAAPTGPRVEQALLDDPLLLRTPIVRRGKEATVGYEPAAWGAWLRGG